MRPKLGVWGSLLPVMIFLTLGAAADNVTVGCAGGPPGNYASLSAALAAVSHNGDTITVSGTCTEVVAIAGFTDLTIIGTPGAALVEPVGVNPLGAVLDISNSQNVVIQTLRIQAVPHVPETAIVVVAVSNSSAEFQDSTIAGASWTEGIVVVPTSSVTLVGATVVENNPDGGGVWASGSGASVLVRRSGSGCPVIRNNGDGLFADNNGTINVRQCAVISGNSFAGIAATAGGTVDIRNPQSTPGSIQVLNNQTGIAAVDGSRLVVRGPMIIQGNSLAGIRARSSSIGVIGATGGGVAGPTITQNGGGGFVCCAVPAGISVAVGSTFEITAVTISGNLAAGFHLTDNSSVRLFTSDSSISGNQGGMVLQNSSTALLYNTPTLSGNSGSDLSCTADSRAYGDGTGIGRMNCPSFQAQSNPGMGAKGKITP
jgi:hypothetical protein